MRKKRNDFDAVGAERMTDTELTKKLGSYQRMESIGILLGVKLVSQHLSLRPLLTGE